MHCSLLLRRFLIRHRAAAALGFAVAILGCSTHAGSLDQDSASTLPVDEPSRVEQRLASLSLSEKAAQMIMVRAYGQYSHPDAQEHKELLASITELRVGGVVLFDSDLASIPPLVNELQRAAAIPLLVAADLERGLAFRVRRGATPLPNAMALGASRSADAARFAGEVTGREALAVGIHWVLAPVVDVNNNPGNPVINLRSFGEDPDLVSKMAAAFIEGARSTGVLTTAKHFPGHGDTVVDSHLSLPVVTADRARLEAVELAPFRRAIAAGVDSVMTGHLAIPALDPSGLPASLSPAISTGVLRGELGFEGLIVTDALEMKGAGVLWSGGAVVQAIRAGADMVLLPLDPRVAIQSIVRAVAEGQLDETRLDASVRKILAAKSALRLSAGDTAGLELAREIGRPEDLERVRAIAASAITLVRNRNGLLPLRAERPLRLLHLVLKPTFVAQPRHHLADAALRSRGLDVETHEIGPLLLPGQLEEIVAAAATATQVVVSSYLRVGAGDSATGFSSSQVDLLESLLAAGSLPVVVSFGNPYLLVQVPEIPAYVCAFGWDAASQEAAVAALLGEQPTAGKLPVSLPGLYPFGHGISQPGSSMALLEVRPSEAGFEPGAMDEIDRIMQGFLERRAFPGAVVAVGHRGALVHLAAYGTLSYDADSGLATTETLYDLASLTKVIATTTMAMILVDEGRLDLDAPIQEYLPLFVGAAKEKVTLRHLLTHSSGVDWWAPLYLELSGQAAYVERIQTMNLVYEPGAKTLYSDLGLILLGEILERVAGEPLDVFVKARVFEPLGMNATLFKPGAELLERIAPTEEDPEWRGRLIHGEVHDENAFALGGVAPHAGLFGTAGDLARLAQMILNGGVLEHHRIVSRETIAEFTRRAGIVDSTRGLGWDTKSAEGSSAGALFSPDSFGHTGFTGTSLWIDPQRELFVVLLTNRVHPTRDNKLIREVRPALADAIVRGLVEE